MKTVVLKFGDTKVRAELNDTDTAEAFYEKLPLTIAVNGTGLDFCGRIPVTLPYEQNQVHNGWKNGDVNYNPQGGWFAVLHSGEEESSIYDDQVVMGRIVDDDLKVLQDLNGSFDLIIEKEE